MRGQGLEARVTEGPDGRRWYVVHSQPRREQIAAGHLAEQGYTVHLPTLRREIRHARRRRVVARPLFPRYLFVAVDVAAERWRPILGTRGVSALMMDGERPRPAPPGVVEALIAASDGQGGYDFSADLARGSRCAFSRGRSRRISGAWSGSTSPGASRC